MSITIMSMAILGPVLGPLYDRGSLRTLMLVGVATMLGGMLLLTQGAALWQLAIFLAITSVGMSMFGFLPVKVMIVNWFVRRRGTALALAYAGTSLAGFVVPPVTAYLIEFLGWRAALLWMAIGAAAIAGPAVALLAVRRPEDVGQHPDGNPAVASHAETEARTPRASFGSLARDANFWRIGLGDALAMCVPVASGVFFVRHLEELGIPRTQVALVLPLMAVFSVMGKITVGVLADRFDARLLAVLTLVLHVLGLFIIATGSGLSAMFAAALPLGLGGGGFLPLPSILQGACFGRTVIGQVSGLHGFLGLPFLLTSAPLVGLAATYTGSFVLPFLGLGAIQLLAAFVLAFVRVPEVEPGIAIAALPD
jgi:MFS family permease